MIHRVGHVSFYIVDQFFLRSHAITQDGLDLFRIVVRKTTKVLVL